MITRLAVVAARQPSTTVSGGEAFHLQAKGRAMGDSDDIRQMSDPDFLAELDDEFIKRAGAAWAEAVQ
jgi:hypothetical protein